MSGSATGRGGARGSGTPRGPGGITLDPVETVLLVRRPHPMDVPLSMLSFVVVAALFGAMAWVLASFEAAGITRTGVPVAFGVVVVVRAIGGEIARRYRVFVLTDRRIVARHGVLRMHIASLPLHRVQHTVMVRRARDRLADLGTVGIATAGTGRFDLAWSGIDGPVDVHERIRAAVAEAGDSASGAAPSAERNAPGGSAERSAPAGRPDPGDRDAGVSPASPP